MGNKHTAGELTTFAFGTLPMCRDESVRNVPWSQRLFTIIQIMFSPSLHMFMHEAEVRHFFNCSPLNDETIGETKRDPIVMLCREEWYLFSETESLSKFATSCSQLLSISISKFSNPVSSGQLHLSTCKTILCLKFFYWSHFFKQFYWILNISLTTKILLLTTLFRPRIVISL